MTGRQPPCHGTHRTRIFTRRLPSFTSSSSPQHSESPERPRETSSYRLANNLYRSESSDRFAASSLYGAVRFLDKDLSRKLSQRSRRQERAPARQGWTAKLPGH